MDVEAPLELLALPPAPGCAWVTTTHRAEVVNRTARYIAENFSEPLNLDDMSRAAGMSKFHLHRVFEEHVGTTLGRYLGGVRLKAALDLLSALETRSMSVLDVALQVGFEDASAFSRSFHRLYGLTPSSFRRGNPPREFPRLGARTGTAELDRGITRVSLQDFWIYGYEVGGQKHKTFTQEAPEGFKLLWDTIRRHGVEGVRSELGLPTYSWVLRDDAWRMLCGFRSSVRLDLGSMKGRLVRAGKWLRARHHGPYSTRWQTWQRLQLQQLRLGRPRDGREPFEEEVELESPRIASPCGDIYFPC